MPQQGAEIDIVTGLPLAMDQTETETRMREREEAKLENQAMFAEIMRSESGVKLLDLIRSYLDTRITELVIADPQASAYVKILNDMGSRDAIGQRAAQVLMNRFFKRQKDQL